jgi:hypothetical protein
MHYGHLPPRRAGGDEPTPVRQRFYVADDFRPQPANVVKVQQKIKTNVLVCQVIPGQLAAAGAPVIQGQGRSRLGCGNKDMARTRGTDANDYQ